MSWAGETGPATADLVSTILKRKVEQHDQYDAPRTYSKASWSWEALLLFAAHRTGKPF
ncbi:hypothetical protein HKBW3C_02309 [Candidatus Hakubella thermalkaliphila]|nr:hypothetical protein HKBW3C_02309 [Candidatus Hakubella thermalkaliphila]